MDVKIFDSLRELSRFAAEYVLKLVHEAAERPEPFALSLAGGSTPRRVYETIAETASHNDTNWGPVHVFWGDERCVPPDNELSNFRTAHESLISRISIPERNIHRIRGELPPREGAGVYERELRDFFGTNKLPVFDLLLLGLGMDAHTASLFPHLGAIREKVKWAVPVRIQGSVSRVTLTLPVINNAKEIIFIVTGGEKADAVFKTLYPPLSPDDYPAQGVRPHKGNVLWLLDKDAASRVEARIRNRDTI